MNVTEIIETLIYIYICSGHLPQEAYHTATSLKNMDSLFNIFNSTSLHDVKLCKCALQDNSPSFEYMSMMKGIFK